MSASRDPVDAAGEHDVDAGAFGDALEVLDVATHVGGGEVDDGADAARLEGGEFLVGGLGAAVLVPEVGPVFADAGGADGDVLVHEGAAEVGGVDGAA